MRKSGLMAPPSNTDFARISQALISVQKDLNPILKELGIILVHHSVPPNGEDSRGRLWVLPSRTEFSFIHRNANLLMWAKHSKSTISHITSQGDNRGVRVI